MRALIKILCFAVYINPLAWLFLIPWLIIQSIKESREQRKCKRKRNLTYEELQLMKSQSYGVDL